MDVKKVINAWACSHFQSVSRSGGLVIIFFTGAGGTSATVLIHCLLPLRIWLFVVVVVFDFCAEQTLFFLLHWSCRSSYSSWLWKPLESPLGRSLQLLQLKLHAGTRQFVVWLGCNLWQTTYCVIEHEKNVEQKIMNCGDCGYGIVYICRKWLAKCLGRIKLM